MKSYIVDSFSLSADKQRAQVIVVTGKGHNRRSFTRHVVRHGSSWVGLNPDERAIPLNKKYDAELRTAEAEMASAEAALKSLEKRLEATKEQLELETNAGIVAVFTDEVIPGIEDAIGNAKMEIEATEALFDDAETKLRIVRRELPLEVEFVGAGLTY